MLCISMRAGDYFTVGSSTVVQFDRLTGDRVHLTINAPREVPILRGGVLERGAASAPTACWGYPPSCEAAPVEPGEEEGSDGAASDLGWHG